MKSLLIYLAVVAAALVLSGCISAGPVGTIAELSQIRKQLAPKKTVAQLREQICGSSYRDVVQTFGDKAPELCPK